MYELIKREQELLRNTACKLSGLKTYLVGAPNKEEHSDEVIDTKCLKDELVLNLGYIEYINKTVNELENIIKGEN